MDFLLDSPSQQGPPQASAGMTAAGASVPGAPATGASAVSAGQATGSAQGLLWTKTQQLPEEAFRQLHSIYGDHFPLEARHHLAGKF